jgi:hypothetical protein
MIMTMWPRWITRAAIALFVLVFASSELGVLKTPSFGAWDRAILGAGLIMILVILYVTRGWLVAALFGSGLLLALLGGPVSIWLVQQRSPKWVVGATAAIDLAAVGLLAASGIIATRRKSGTPIPRRD